MTPLHTIHMLNIEGVHASLAYMPRCIYQDYCKWVLTQPDLTRQWSQLMGITNLARLTYGLLDKLLTKAELDALIPYTVPMNVFNMYEIISDNLAIGLAYRLPHDETCSLRREIVRGLNSAVVARLRGAQRQEALNHIPQHLAQDSISIFTQSLSRDKHLAFATAFTALRPDVSLEAIEYSLYPNLVANVEVCHQVVKTLDGYLTQELVYKGFRRRYAGLTRLLDETYIPRNYLVQLGGNTIMVQPVLGYYIAVIAEEVHLIHNYETIVENGLLLKALEDAAVITRLLNDLGPCLLEQTETDHEQLASALYRLQRRYQFTSFHELLLHMADNTNVALARIKKDVKFGEFNLCLYEPYRSASVVDAIESFYDQLCFLSRIYAECWGRLHESLGIINLETRSTLITDIILRFIDFHEQMYRVEADKAEGEFAV